jgi:hypothetical protein
MSDDKPSSDAEIDAEVERRLALRQAEEAATKWRDDVDAHMASTADWQAMQDQRWADFELQQRERDTASADLAEAWSGLQAGQLGKAASGKIATYSTVGGGIILGLAEAIRVLM